MLDQDIREAALELRLETAENLENVVSGLFYVNALECGLLLNRDAARRDLPPAYDYVVLAGFAKAAEQAFGAAEGALSTAFKQDKSLNKNYAAFVKAMGLLAQMFKAWLYYQHFYDTSVDPDAAEADVEMANTQKHLMAARLQDAFTAFEKVRIAAAGVSDWFAQRFEPYGKEFQRVAARARRVPGVPFDGATPVSVKPTSYTRPQPLWTSLNTPALDKLVQKLKLKE